MISKRYILEDIRASMMKEGYTLLSTEYSSTKKLKYICSKGHVSAMLSCNWNKGRRCPLCKGIKLGKQKRLKFNIIIKSFESEGYILLSEKRDYRDNESKLNYICPEGHKHSISWTKWQQGRRCRFCSKNSPITFNIAKKSFEDEGYELLSTSYNYNKKLKYKCSLGHINYISWGHWQQGKRCPDCWSVHRFGEGHPNWKGGKSFEPYCQIWKDQEFKNDIKERDGNKCLNPYCDSNKPNDLTIHHIDYDKKNCHPSNLITVCRSCNSRANKDRRWHRAWYQAIISKRYGRLYER